DAWLSDFAATCAYLDGQAPPPSSLRTDFAEGAMYLVYHLRQLACKLLRPSPRADDRYCLEDYFYCLYFTYLRMLFWPKFKEGPPRSRLALLGASMALQVLN